MTTISYQVPEQFPNRFINPLREHLNSIVKAMSSVKPNRRISLIPQEAINHDKQVIIAIGKNAAAFTRALRQKLPNPPLHIFVFQTKGYSNIDPTLRSDWDYWEVDHPLPSKINFEKTKYVLEKLDNLDTNTIFHFIVTGGGSASFALPEPEIGEENYLHIVTNAQAFGFSIATLNYIRSLIDQVKGGKFALRYRNNSIYTWCVSDVISDDPSIIASGPTVPGINDIPRIDDWLNHIFPSSPPMGQPTLIKNLKIRLKRVREMQSSRELFVKVITRRQDLLNSLFKRLKKSNINPVLANVNLQGDINQVCEEMKKKIDQYIMQTNTTIIWSGEPEVNIPVSALTHGKGGRISALLTLLAEKIESFSNLVLIGIASDGVDGSSPSSGYFITSETSNHFRPLGGANKIISKGNSGSVLTSLGYGIQLGITDINLLDIYLAIIV